MSVTPDSAETDYDEANSALILPRSVLLFTSI